MPNRQGQSDKYRYGFNGKERDDEVKGEGNSYDFGSRNTYDPRVGRFFATDPNMGDYSSYSPYIFAANNPIIFIDKDGENPIIGKLLFEAISYIRQNVTSEKAAIQQANHHKLVGLQKEAHMRQVGLYDGVLSAIDIKQQVKDGAADFVQSFTEWWESSPFENNTFGQKSPLDMERTILGPSGISRKRQVEQIINIIENFDELPAYTQGQIEGVVYASIGSLIITRKPVSLRLLRKRLRKFNLRFKNVYNKSVSTDNLINTSTKISPKPNAPLQTYSRKGTYKDAVKEFNSLKGLDPESIKPIKNSKFEGFQGSLSDGRTVSVRSGSSGRAVGTESKPTLQINPAKGTEGKRLKFRYEND